MKSLKEILQEDGLPGIEYHFKEKMLEKDKSWAYVCILIMILWIADHLIK